MLLVYVAMGSRRHLFTFAVSLLRLGVQCENWESRIPMWELPVSEPNGTRHNSQHD